MRTIFRNNYTPVMGEYHERYVIDEARHKSYLFDCDGVFNELPYVYVANEKGQSEEYAVSQKLFTDETTKLADDIDYEAAARAAADIELGEAIDSATTLLSNAIEEETTAREGADTDLQNQIDLIKAASDVVDVVGTHADLEAYDTSKLNDNDIVKVLEDETHDGDITYYRWNTSTSAFTFVGALSAYYSKDETDTLLAAKQDTLTAGSNITINNNVISATDTTYTAGTGLTLTGTEFAVDTTTIAQKADIPTVNNATLTITQNGTSAGTFTANSSTDATIALTDTTYSAFTGTDGTAAGAAGLVPAPATTDAGKYLKADGTWAAISVPTVTLYSGTGQNTDGAMTQKAVTDTIFENNDTKRVKIGNGATTSNSSSIAIGESATASGTNALAIGPKENQWNKTARATGANSISIGTGQAKKSYAIAIGQYVVADSTSAIAIGRSTSVYTGIGIAIGDSVLASSDDVIGIGSSVVVGGARSIAIGKQAKTEVGSNIYEDSIALGSYSTSGRVFELSIGTPADGSNAEKTRYIAHVTAGVNDTDAVNKKQLDDAIAAVPSASNINSTDWSGLWQ